VNVIWGLCLFTGTPTLAGLFISSLPTRQLPHHHHHHHHHYCPSLDLHACSTSTLTIATEPIDYTITTPAQLAELH
jgi:hypothetical protein